MDDSKKGQIDYFRSMVKMLIEIESHTIVGNSSPAHAKVLLEEMFKHAKETAYVYCGKISNEVWGGDAVANAVRTAIEKGVTVRFIVQHPEQVPQDSAVKRILDEHKIQIHSSPKFGNIASHFAVFDGKMYRFENDDTAKTAKACMNSVDLGAKLKSLAEQMLEVA